MLTSQYGCTTGTGNGIATVIILKYRPFMPNTVNMGSRSYFTYGMSIYTLIPQHYYKLNFLST